MPFPLLGTFVVCRRCQRPISAPQSELAGRVRLDGQIWCDECRADPKQRVCLDSPHIGYARRFRFPALRGERESLSVGDPVWVCGDGVADSLAVVLAVSSDGNQVEVELAEPAAGLSDASCHALAITGPAGHEPTPEHLDLLRRLDVGELTVGEAIEIVKDRFQPPSEES